MATSAFQGFPPGTLKFLKDLKQHNDREWFAENKSRYEEMFAAPALEFIREIEKPLHKISPFLQAIPKKVGGSLLRVYRDTRFSPDKTPYKTHIGIQFRHEAGCNIHAPGVYLHIEPGNVFLGTGIWRPEKDPLLWIRQKIQEEPQDWKKVTSSKKFKANFELQGESLKRPPKGFDKEDPAIEEIKRKDFIAVSKLPDKAIQQSDFIPQLCERIKITTPLMVFLCEALDLNY